MRKNELSASFTVEAAVVVPILIFCIAGIISLVFYLHDQVKSVADVDKCFFDMEMDAALYKGQHTEYSEDVSDSLKKYFGGTVEECIKERDGSNMKVHIAVNENTPEGGLFGLILPNISRIERTEERSISNREETARLIKAAKELVSDLTGIAGSNSKEE